MCEESGWKDMMKFLEWKRSAEQGALGKMYESGHLQECRKYEDAPLGSRYVVRGASSRVTQPASILCFSVLQFALWKWV